MHGRISKDLARNNEFDTQVQRQNESHTSLPENFYQTPIKSKSRKTPNELEKSSKTNDFCSTNAKTSQQISLTGKKSRSLRKRSGKISIHSIYKESNAANSPKILSEDRARR